jgi:PIN like domain
MRFFFDRNLSYRIARMIDAFDPDHDARHLDDDRRFVETAGDTEWITTLSGDEPPWHAIVSLDARMLTRPDESAALRRSGLKFFVLERWDRMKLHEQAWKFVKVWPDIVQHAAGHRAKVFEVVSGRSLKVVPRPI